MDLFEVTLIAREFKGSVLITRLDWNHESMGIFGSDNNYFTFSEFMRYQFDEEDYKANDYIVKLELKEGQWQIISEYSIYCHFFSKKLIKKYSKLSI